MVAAVLASRRSARIRVVSSIVIVLVGTAIVVAFASVMYRSFCCAYDSALGIPALTKACGV
jgi:fucose permease